MNKIRKRWKSNGTPFFFRFRYDDIVVSIDTTTCQALDTVLFDDGRHSCLDILVDIHFVVMQLQQVSSFLVYDSVKYELYTIFELVVKCAHLTLCQSDGIYHYVLEKKE